MVRPLRKYRTQQAISGQCVMSGLMDINGSDILFTYFAGLPPHPSRHSLHSFLRNAAYFSVSLRKAPQEPVSKGTGK